MQVTSTSKFQDVPIAFLEEMRVNPNWAPTSSGINNPPSVSLRLRELLPAMECHHEVIWCGGDAVVRDDRFAALADGARMLNELKPVPHLMVDSNTLNGHEAFVREHHASPQQARLPRGRPEDAADLLQVQAQGVGRTEQDRACDRGDVGSL